ncbi:MAG: anthranilate synthase component I [Hyphomonadaceae bacterium]|nr:anthranilate synthase component I [Hyphomonadaceae bacterium]
MNSDIVPSRNVFEEAYKNAQAQLVYISVVNDLDTPVSAYEKICRGKPYAFLFESVQGGEQRGRYSIMGFSPDLVWRSFGDMSEVARGERSENYAPMDGSPLEALRRILNESAFDIPHGLPPMATGLFGYLGYDLVRQVEHLPGINPDPIGTPDAIMVRPTIVAVFDQILQEIILATPVYPSDLPADAAYTQACKRLESVESGLSLPKPGSCRKAAPETHDQRLVGTDREIFKSRVAKAKAYIEAGDVFQVVIGQRLETDFTYHPFALYRSLRRMNPAPFLYFLDFDDHAIIGSSPEILVRLRNRTVTIRPVAGTRPRGKTGAEDLANETDLLSDEKECAEHLMLLDLGRNDVGRTAQSGTVTVTERNIVERYSHVMHIVSNIEGRIKDGLDALDALMAGFPAGTVSGAPKVRAMEIIDELEAEKRGIYGGAVGYISAGGDMDTAIALRTGVVKNGKLHVRAGAGIVADSHPDLEFEETLHKAAALFRAADHCGQFDGN